MQTYFESKNKSDCNGCGTCALRCPVNAITMEEDSEGFLYPVVNKNKCINCGLCKKVCSNNPIKKSLLNDTYIAYTKNEQDLKKSSSGGIFGVLAKSVIEDGGVVFGVCYSEKLEVIHDYIEKTEDIDRFRYSKYVRSNLKESYKKCEEFLDNGRKVLFTGTPCQCAGLRTFLKKEYNNLITCEIVCFSNSSPKVFKMYLKNLEAENNSKIEKIIFRYKKYGWHGGNTYTIFKDGTEKETPEFTNAFLGGIINRPSCHNCHFCYLERYSDITIGDFWGIENYKEYVEDKNTGVSILNINTENGNKLFEQIRNNIFYKKVDREKAFSANHHFPAPANRRRTRFFRGVKNNKINEKNIIKKLKKYNRGSLIKKAIKRIIKIVKK